MHQNSSAKRAHGTGSAIEVSPGKSRIFYTVDGKRRSLYCATDEVETKLMELQLAVKQQKPLPVPRDRRVGAYALAWIEDQRANLRGGTWAGYDSNVRNHIVPSLGKMRLADVRADDVRRLHKESKARGLAPRSVRYVHTVLSLILAQAEADELIDKNYAKLKKAKPPSAPKKKIRPWTEKEALHFLDEVQGDVHEALYITTLGLALRRGEALGLRWSDIDFPNRTATIAGQLQRRRARYSQEGDRLHWAEPKTDASIAIIDLPEFVVEALAAHRDREKVLRHYSEDGYVFTSSTGTPLEPDNITHRFPEFLRQRGMRHQRFHDLRHSAASLLLAKGVPLWMVSKILRHSGLSITTDVYGHLLKQTSVEAADVMSGILSGRA